ncbi:discoidin, CUB and LCCL domain-containing protein 1 [Ornithorhynchus anatinus]|nr:discoidin, CUB and LCCL domain-containing protein 1 [Ornithorhynchus anatinus]
MGRGARPALLPTLPLLLLGLSAPLGLQAETPGDGCGHMVTHQESGTLASKNYPGTCPNHTVCEKTISVPAGKRLILRFGDLDIKAQSCDSDYVLLSSSTARYGLFCSSLPESKEITLDTNEVTVRFESGSLISGRGFLLSYASSDHPDLITCLEKGSHFSQANFSKFCPAGCRDIAGEVSGNVESGYRDTSVLCKAAIHAGVLADELGGQIHVRQLKGISHYEGLRANGVSSREGSLSDRRFLFISDGCSDLLEVDAGRQTTTSSPRPQSGPSGRVIRWFPGQEGRPQLPELARATGNGSDGRGGPGSPGPRKSLKIDLGEKKRITGIWTTGSAQPNSISYVETFVLNFKNNSKWQSYREVMSNKEKVFPGNVNFRDPVRNNLIPPIEARYVRLIPQTWHKGIALEVSLLGCAATPGGPLRGPGRALHPLSPRAPAFSPAGSGDSFGCLGPSGSAGGSDGKEDMPVTELVPSVEMDLGLKFQALVIPLGLCVSLLVAGAVVYATLRRRKLKGSGYGAAAAPQSGCWRRRKHQSAEFTISYEPEKEAPPKLDLVTRAMTGLEYQQPLLMGTGTVTKKGSTFKPMDAEDRLGSGEPGGRAARPPWVGRHEYALPLPSQGPEYATPIVERHRSRGTAFPPEDGYRVPSPATAAHARSLSAGGFSGVGKMDARHGDYAQPVALTPGIGDYDRPTGGSAFPAPVWGTADSSVPQMDPPGDDGYSTPRDCLKTSHLAAETADPRGHPCAHHVREPPPGTRDVERAVPSAHL